MDTALQEKLRAIPGIDRLLEVAGAQADLAALPRALIVQILREAVDTVRCNIQSKQAGDCSVADILAQTRKILLQKTQAKLKRVINATGVVLHTNLGRAPLSLRAQARIAEIAAGYSNLEYDVAGGERGSRYSHIADCLCSLTGAEAVIVVNNNAAAVLLALSALASGREVIVSRGQLVEIGGSFRVPDVLRQSGATLVEVGTTNKTHLYDYEQAIGANTAAVLKVHTSNYRIVGFTSQPKAEALVEMTHNHQLPIIEDLGSGTLLSLPTDDWHEPSVGECLAAGIDVVTFSGDKLFGGAQAGIIAGKKQYISLMEKHPLLRAVRIDKLSLAAIEGTLQDYVLGNPLEDIPAQAMLCRPLVSLEKSARKFATELEQAVDAFEFAVIRLESQAGGGALPEVEFASYGISIKAKNMTTGALEKKLREQTPPVVARIQDDRVILDMRCLSASDTVEICGLLQKIGKEGWR